MPPTRVPVRPAVLTWSQRRGGHDDETMRHRFSSWDDWIAETKHPTVKQAEDLAQFTHVPFGTLLLPEPPVDELPIPDFRVGRVASAEPSQNLLDVIHLCQRRQDWYAEYAERSGILPDGFLRGEPAADATELAARMRHDLQFDPEDRGSLRRAEGARRHLMRAFEGLGGLVVISSTVGNSTRRVLDVDEVRGFTLHDPVAPLVFVNAADTIRGQVFSLAHEFAHVARGESGVSAEQPQLTVQSGVEQWCNDVASEFLVPADHVAAQFDPHVPLTAELDRLADLYLCSTLVVLLRLRDTRQLQVDDFDQVYRREVERLRPFVVSPRSAGGGDFYRNQPFKIGETLSRAIIRDTQEGRTPVRDALRLLGFRSVGVLDRYARELDLQ